MMDADGDFIGEVCHIEAAETGGQRFNPKQSNEDRRAFSNLMLMCHACHKKTDNVKKYTVEILQKMKRDHEKKFSDIVSKLQNSISDLTTLQDYSYTLSCKRINESLNWKLDSTQLKDMCDEINQWVERLRKLSPDTRNVFSIMIDRSTLNSWDQPQVIIHEIAKVTDLDFEGMKEHYDLLYKYNFISKAEREEEDNTVVVTIKPFILTGWPFWIDLKKFCDVENINLNEIVGEMNFGLLD
ncbi:hypothetical protein [Paenibacillus sp. AGC30]